MVLVTYLRWCSEEDVHKAEASAAALRIEMHGLQHQLAANSEVRRTVERSPLIVGEGRAVSSAFMLAAQSFLARCALARKSALGCTPRCFDRAAHCSQALATTEAKSVAARGQLDALQQRLQNTSNVRLSYASGGLHVFMLCVGDAERATQGCVRATLNFMT